MKKGIRLCFALFGLVMMLPTASAHAEGIGNAIGYATGDVTAYFIEAPRYPNGRYYYVDRKRAVDKSLTAECERMGNGYTATERCVEKLRGVIQAKVPANNNVLTSSSSLKPRSFKHSKSDIKQVMRYIRGRRVLAGQ